MRSELPEDASPALGRSGHTTRVEDRPHLGCAGAEAFEVAMLELDKRSLVADRYEPDLDLGHELWLVLPLGRDLPCKHESMRGLPDEDVAPQGFTPVDAALVPTSSGEGLDGCGLVVGGSDV